MTEPSSHLSALSLEQLAEGTLPSSEAEAARAHLAACAHCTEELAGYRALFAMLGSLPRFTPSPAFADAVMARVQMAPQESAVTAWLRRWVPTTRRGWLLLGTVVTAPVTPIIALVGLMLVQPLLTPTALWQWSMLRVQALAQASVAWAADRAGSFGVWDWIAAAYTTIQDVPASALLGLSVLISISIPLSAWGLVKLIRTPGRSVTYAN